ncbi:MAG: TadE/TadG family type IV pilus assembly protein [Elusimicrobiota bacterium]
MTRRARRSGQVIVEMLLILPVFLGIVFTIMEIGYVSFQLIVLNHATYEVARVGGMTWLAPNGGAGRLSSLMKSILPLATVSCSEDKTLMDPQAQLQNMDLVCTGSENVKLVFPISSIMLAKPAGSGTRALSATVRMPIEQPLAQ